MVNSQKKLISKFDLNGGDLARRYASLPYGFYKEEIYPIFCELLDSMGNAIRVLDIGAGPGHLAVEFYRRRPQSEARFALMDSSYELLSIGAERLFLMGFQVEIFHRNYNLSRWEEGIGKFDAIVSNNSLFSLNPVLLGQFYKIVYDLLNANGVFLNQQAFNPQPLKKAFKAFYSVLGPERYMSEEDKLRAAEITDVLADIDTDEMPISDSEIARLKAEGWQLDTTPSYASLSLSVDRHLEFMRLAGFTSTCIWRKMHFAVVAGLKGQPYADR